jgi:hypothetical protein
MYSLFQSFTYSSELELGKISCGNEHSVFVSDRDLPGRPAGVYGWGRGTEGQLGTLGFKGKRNCEPIEIVFSGDFKPPIKQVACSFNATFFLTDYGDVYFSGSLWSKIYRRLTRLDIPEPIKQISNSHSLSENLFLSNSGRVYYIENVLHFDENPAMGVIDSPDETDPIKIIPRDLFPLDIGNFFPHRVDGSFFLVSEKGFLHFVDIDHSLPRHPRLISGFRFKETGKIRELAQNAYNFFFLNEEGEVFMIQRGTEIITHHTQLEDKIILKLDLPPVRHISRGNNLTAFLTEEGDVYMAGKGTHGELGTGTTEDHPIPVKISLPTTDPVKEISSGGSRTLFLTVSGEIYSCGTGSYGSLGTGDISRSLVPIRVSGF